MKLLKISAMLFGSLGVPYLLLGPLYLRVSDLAPFGVLPSLLAFAVPRGRPLVWAASVTATALIGFRAWLEYVLRLEHPTAGTAIGAAYLWFFAVLTVGCFGLVLLLRIAVGLAMRLFRKLPSDGLVIERER